MLKSMFFLECGVIADIVSLDGFGTATICRHRKSEAVSN